MTLCNMGVFVNEEVSQGPRWGSGVSAPRLCGAGSHGRPHRQAAPTVKRYVRHKLPTISSINEWSSSDPASKSELRESLCNERNVLRPVTEAPREKDVVKIYGGERGSGGGEIYIYNTYYDVVAELSASLIVERNPPGERDCKIHQKKTGVTVRIQLIALPATTTITVMYSNGVIIVAVAFSKLLVYSYTSPHPPHTPSHTTDLTLPPGECSCL
ncbi:hypothetical protein J6590_047669 [Homalodisca vitripennis]|nr:hypothetical protein J6590_047669 [Homalodisca vitripennis]